LEPLQNVLERLQNLLEPLQNVLEPARISNLLLRCEKTVCRICAKPVAASL
jgi:hypothetical protein